MKFDDETCTLIYKIMRGLMIGLAILCITIYGFFIIIFPNLFYEDVTIHSLLIWGIPTSLLVYKFNNELKINNGKINSDKLMDFFSISLSIFFITCIFAALTQSDIYFAIKSFLWLCVVTAVNLLFKYLSGKTKK